MCVDFDTCAIVTPLFSFLARNFTAWGEHVTCAEWGTLRLGWLLSMVTARPDAFRRFRAFGRV